jgi:hypothetical protein
MRSYLEEKVATKVQKPEINGCEEPPRWPRDTLLSAKFGTKIPRPEAVGQSVEFAWGLKSTEFVLVCWLRFPTAHLSFSGQMN